jgi:hypothetical protein
VETDALPIANGLIDSRYVKGILPQKLLLHCQSVLPDNSDMTKKFAKKTASKRKKSKRAVLGVTSDGVRILQPKKATNFTQSELRAAIGFVRAARSG